MKKLKLIFLMMMLSSGLFAQNSWFKLDIQLDQWPEENCWELRDFTTDTLIYDDCGENYDPNEFIELFIPLPSGQYIFNFVDEFGDGLSMQLPSYVLLTNECQDTLSYVHGFGTSYNGDDSLALANGWTIPGIITQGFTSAAELIDTLTLAPCAPPTTFIPGCMDPIAGNYDSLATVPQWGYSDQSSCTYIIGCMNPNALNYDSLATQDDYALCLWPPCNGFDASSVSESCNGDQTILTFEWLTTQDLYCDVAEIHYGYDPSASPYVQGQWFQGDVPLGATPPTTLAYTIFECSYWDGNLNVFEAKAGGNFVTQDIPHFFFVKFNDDNYSDTLWIAPEPCIVGCTDPTSSQYNPFATIDNGSCQTTGTQACGPDSTTINIILTPDTYSGETSWELIDSTTTPPTIIASSPLYSGLTGIPTSTIVCVDSTMNLVFNLYDSYGDGMCGSCFGGVDGEVLILDQSCNDTLFSLTSPGMNFGVFLTESIGLLSPCNGGNGPLSGCTDPGFVEYNPAAIVDDGSCLTTVILGCIDSTSFNYNPIANQQLINPSCNYTLRLTDGAGDGWFGSYIGVVQGDSLFGPYTVQTGSQLDINLNLGTIEPAKIYLFTQGNSSTTVNQCGVQLINPEGTITFSAGTNPWTDVMVGFPNVYTALQDCGSNCIPVISGCLDSLAFNYNSLVNTDDGSCYYTPGCTSPAYLEYHTQGFFADFDDGSCLILAEFGCTDSTSFNYNSYATVNWTSATDSDNPCIPTIYGCTDPIAFNFISLTGDPFIDVNTNDNSCIPVINGCTDSTMWNYNFLANTDNGTCVPFIYGCTDNSASNYNALANANDNSCYYAPGCTDANFLQFYTQGFNADYDDGSCIDSVLYGCTDPTMFNYNASANMPNGSCIPFNYGCMDTTAFNYDPIANAEFTPSNCIATVLGCTDPSALNFAPAANVDDGTCIPILFGCMDSIMYNYNPLANTEYTPSNCVPFIYGCTDNTAFNYNPQSNTSDNSCYYAPGCTDPNFIQFWNQGFTADYDNGNCIDSVVYGCMDPSQYNYNASANLSDGSCIAFVFGCMDNIMFNFNPLANTEYTPSNCIPYTYGCMDSTAFNYNAIANVEDGSCYWYPGCTDPVFLQFHTQGYIADYDNGTCLDTAVWGCTDPSQFNYDSLANIENTPSTCIPVILGCMDDGIIIDYDGDSLPALNYNPFANIEDGTCATTIYGCMDNSMWNYNSLANIDVPGTSCIPFNYGCMDTTMWNYNALANSQPGGACIPFNYGCMDPVAFNYSFQANTEDGSCYYDPGCTDPLYLQFWTQGFTADYDNGTCIDLAVYGCTDPIMLNYDSLSNIDDGTCIPIVYGCMDDGVSIDYDGDGIAALNYNPLANVDDSSCTTVVYGCMQNTMWNFNGSANVEITGSCIPFSYGCMDTTMWNYDPLANTEYTPSNCIPYIYGCTDPTASNFVPSANSTDNSCYYAPGCTDPLYLQFWTQGFTADYDNGSCVDIAVYGCMNPVSFNYNSLANIDDGTCIPVILGCMDDGVLIDYDGDGIAALNYNPLANTEDGSCVTVVYGCMDASQFNYDPSANIEPPNFCIPYAFGCMDATMWNYDPLANTEYNPSNCIPFYYGCMDDGAFNDLDGDGYSSLNYDPLANTNEISAIDNSDPCIQRIFGCMDTSSFNYDILANTDDGTCIATVLGCTDELDFQGYLYDTYISYIPGFSTVEVTNYNPLANTDDGSCLYYDINSVTGAGSPYWLNDTCYQWVVYEVDPYCLTNQWDAFCQAQYNLCEDGTPLAMEDLARGQILVYPNPTRGIVTIKTNEDINVDVYDMRGNHLIHKENAREIDLSNFSMGMYDLKITYKGYIINHRIIKQ